VPKVIIVEATDEKFTTGFPFAIFELAPQIRLKFK